MDQKIAHPKQNNQANHFDVLKCIVLSTALTVTLVLAWANFVFPLLNWTTVDYQPSSWLEVWMFLVIVAAAFTSFIFIEVAVAVVMSRVSILDILTTLHAKVMYVLLFAVTFRALWVLAVYAGT